MLKTNTNMSFWHRLLSRLLSAVGSSKLPEMAWLCRQYYFVWWVSQFGIFFLTENFFIQPNVMLDCLSKLAPNCPLVSWKQGGCTVKNLIGSHQMWKASLQGGIRSHEGSCTADEGAHNCIHTKQILTVRGFASEEKRLKLFSIAL